MFQVAVGLALLAVVSWPNALASTVVLVPAVDPPSAAAQRGTRPPTSKPTSTKRPSTLYPSKRPTTSFPTRPTAATTNEPLVDACQAFANEPSCRTVPTCDWIDISFVMPPDFTTEHEFHYGCRTYNTFCEVTQGTALEQQFQCGSRAHCQWKGGACSVKTSAPTPSGGLPSFCADSCDFCANNGVCEDGGPGSVVGGLCFPGSDCSDCGPGDRTEPITPKTPPQPNAHCVGTVG